MKEPLVHQTLQRQSIMMTIREIPMLKEPYDATGLYFNLIHPKHRIDELEKGYNLHPRTPEEAKANKAIYLKIQQVLKNAGAKKL